MITVKDILDYIEALAPSSLKMEWDNVGLLCGDANCPVHKIMVALDPFESVCYEAYDAGADLLITHHPLIFVPPHSITNQTSVGRSIMFLCEKGISAINAHTNLDCAPGGVNDILAQTLELEDVSVIKPKGLLRMGTFSTELPYFLAHVKHKLGTPMLRYVDGGKPVHKVAVGGGACADGLLDVYDAGCDTFITADVKYNQFWDAKDLGINLIDAGHFYTENPVCAHLARQLSEQFPELVVEISKKHRDCMEFA